MDHRVSRGMGEVIRDEMVIKDRIVNLLQENPRTIPQIAEALGYPSYEVVYWVMAMWRYGAIEEIGNPDEFGYYQYQLKH